MATFSASHSQSLTWERAAASSEGPANIICPFNQAYLYRGLWDICMTWTLCNSWYCDTCAPRKATRIYDQAIPILRAWESVWYSTCMLGNKAEKKEYSTRLRQRRKRAGGEYLWTRQYGHRMHLFASGELGSPRMEPHTGDWLVAKEALAVLEDAALATPGVMDMGHSAGLQVSPAKPKNKSDGSAIPLRATGQNHVNEVSDAAVDEFEAQYGFHPQEMNYEVLVADWYPIVVKVDKQYQNNERVFSLVSGSPRWSGSCLPTQSGAATPQ